MTCRGVLFRICSLLVLLLLPSRTIAQDGKLALYLDASCNKPSQSLPTVLLPLNTCLIPLGVYGVAIVANPACPNDSTPTMIMYQDSICARSTAGHVYFSTCFYYGPMFTIPSIMFTCDDPANVPQPTSTSTVTATKIAGVATSSAGGTTGGTTGGATTSIDSASTTTGGTSSPTSGSQGTSGGSSGSAGSTGSSGLGTSEKIAIGVGLGVGVPTILVGLAAWLWPRNRKT